MAAERSRSPMGSPVPACMFAPEPSPPGSTRAAAAAARLHTGFDSDCSEDGEALNGEPELDLTSKLVLVSPTSEQYDNLLRQMWERMDEGCGETIYVIGQGSGEHRSPSMVSLARRAGVGDSLRCCKFRPLATIVDCCNESLWHQIHPQPGAETQGPRRTSLSPSIGVAYGQLVLRPWLAFQGLGCPGVAVTADRTSK
ncbi:GTP-binding protein 1 [Petaurus breviceps papuanus]|uniref:GTP-binding protein 1 n=1 Tax=Petaurus breviceps papuanus TaxID=3040969 RepID=UPI0036D9EFE1